MNTVDQVRYPRVGLACFLIKDHEYYIHKRKGSHGKGDWSIPGGHLEYGESIRQGLAREIKEETGVIIDPDEKYDRLRFRGIVNSVFDTLGLHYVTIFYEYNLKPDQEPQIMEPSKSSEPMWMSVNRSPPEPLFLPLKLYWQRNYEFAGPGDVS